MRISDWSSDVCSSDLRPMVGEVNLGRPDLLAPYYGDGDELHLVFNFTLQWQPWTAPGWAKMVERAERAFAPNGAWPVWVLSNHDVVRHRTRYGGSEGRRSEEHTSELQSLMRISYAVFCLKKKNKKRPN